MLGDNIRKYRKENNMSQEELADKLFVTRQSVSLWENGQTQPSLDNIVALAKLFNISTDDLLKSNDTDIMPALNSNAVSEKHSDNNSKKGKVILICLVLLLMILVSVLISVLVVHKSKSVDKNFVPNEEKTSYNEVVNETEKSTTALTSTTEKKTTEKNVIVKKKKTVKNHKDRTIQQTVARTTTAAVKKTVTKKKAPSQKNIQNLYAYLKNYVVKHGKLNGDYCVYSKDASKYGGYSGETFSLYYWGDTDTVEFCLHSVIDDTFSINFYLIVPKTYTGEYEYKSSYYYRDNGEPLYEAVGTIQASEFTHSYPLRSTNYIGSSDYQDDFMEMSRVGMCDLLSILKSFLQAEKMEYTLSDMGFKKF